MTDIPRTARGVAKLATDEEIAKEASLYYLTSDLGFILTTDNGDPLIPNTGDFGYTHPNLHRRIETDPFNIESGQASPPYERYPFVYYDDEGVPYKQTVKFGVWDGVNSYRTTETHTHDEESTTCEIP